MKKLVFGHLDIEGFTKFVLLSKEDIRDLLDMNLDTSKVSLVVSFSNRSLYSYLLKFIEEHRGDLLVCTNDSDVPPEFIGRFTEVEMHRLLKCNDFNINLFEFMYPSIKYMSNKEKIIAVIQ